MITGKGSVIYFKRLVLFFKTPNYRFILAGIYFLFLVGQLHAQSPLMPPNQLNVYTTQELSFGSFYAGSSGGRVIISPDGNRITTGSVTGLALSPGTPAIFDVRLIPGRVVHISFPSSAMLYKVGSGENMTINDFTTDKRNNYFVTTSAHPFINTVKVGASLFVGNISFNPAGDYFGSFNVVFIQE